MLMNSPINTIGTNFAFGETRNLSSSSLVKVHHLLVRARAWSSREHARARTNQWKLFRICVALQPAKYRRGLGIIRPNGRALPPRRRCGAEETRTPDFLLAKEALYQLSYGPRGTRRILRLTEEFESSARWAFVDSNHRPLPYQGSALTS